MKRFILLLFLLFGFTFYSCNDWLDVKSNEEVLEKDAFETNEGFRLALIGAYQIAAESNLWGRELTWGFISALGRNYVQTNLPVGYTRALVYENYEYDATKAIIKNIWEKGYRLIANCNNLLQNIEKTNNDFFEYDYERDMIIAEARALRGLMHFELLRLFTAAPITGYNGVAIPYVFEYPDYSPTNYTLDEIIEFVLEDILFAKEILEEIDCNILFEKSGSPNIASYLFHKVTVLDILKEERPNLETFFDYRGYRMNYWAVTALTARIYSYKRDNAKAVEIIDDFFSKWVGDGKFEWAYWQSSTSPNTLDGKRVPETIMAFWNSDAYTIYEDALYETGQTTSTLYRMTLTALFGNERSEDYRYTTFFNTSNSRYRVWDRVTNEVSLTSLPNKIAKFSGPLLPVLELPELYFIKCEYLAEQGRINDAVNLLQELRFARNVLTINSATDYDGFMNLLVNEVTRDFLTRGQTWHYLKKLDWKEMFNHGNTYWTVVDGWYVLPIPDSEINFF